VKPLRFSALKSLVRRWTG